MPFVLVTGATGFIGSAIVEHLQRLGFPLRTTGRAASPSPKLPEYTSADLLEPSQLRPLVQDVRCVVHAAGLAHQFGSRRSDASRFMRVNVDGTVNLLKAASSAGVGHFLLLSSVSVYGPHSREGCDEEHPCSPVGPYAASKHRAELAAYRHADQTRMALSVLRLATVYGEGDPGNLLRLLRAIDRSRFIWIGKGQNRKSLIHRDDVARACEVVLAQPPSGTVTYNVSAPSCTMAEMVHVTAGALGRRVPRWHVPAGLARSTARFVSALGAGFGRIEDVAPTVEKWLSDDVYPADRFRKHFAYEPRISFDEGIAREVRWYREHCAR